MTFSLGPVMYFYIFEISGKKNKPFTGIFWHFTPAILCFIFFVFYSSTNSSILNYYKRHTITYPCYDLNPLVTTLSILADSWLAVYFIMAMKKHSFFS